MIKVSVIINNYNYGRYLPRAVESVLAQDFPADQMEIIIVDDGSTDDSAERAAAYGERVIYHRQENRGQAGALNAGFARARGAYVALLDADDEWLPGKLRKVIARFEANLKTGLVQHWMRTVDAEGRPLPTYVEHWPERYAFDDLRTGRARFVGTSGLAFRKEEVKGILPIPEDLRFCADEYLYTHVLFKTEAENIPEMLGLRRVHGTNSYAGTLLKPEALERRIRVRQSLDAHLTERCRGLYLAVPEGLRLSSERERLLCEIFRDRLEGAWARAWRARCALLKSFPKGQRRLLKGASLTLAWVSPAAYAFMLSLYQRINTTWRQCGRLDWRTSVLDRLDRLAARRRMPRFLKLLRHPVATAKNSMSIRALNLLSRFGAYFTVSVKTVFDETMAVVVPTGCSDVWLYGASVDCDAEVRLTKYMLLHIGQGDVFFDLGANLGYYSLLASRLVGNGGLVCAFEPSPSLLPLLNRNLKGKSNARVIDKAASDKRGSANFFIAPFPYIGTSSLLPDWQERETEEVRVETVSLDDYCFANGIFPDSIKIDVEGAEDLVIKGASRLLREKPPVLIVEVVFSRMDFKKTITALKESGWAPFAIEDSGRLRALSYDNLGEYLNGLQRKYRIIQDSPNDFDNLIFKRR